MTIDEKQQIISSELKKAFKFRQVFVFISLFIMSGITVAVVGFSMIIIRAVLLFYLTILLIASIHFSIKMYEIRNMKCYVRYGTLVKSILRSNDILGYNRYYFSGKFTCYIDPIRQCSKFVGSDVQLTVTRLTRIVIDVSLIEDNTSTE